MFPDEGGYAFFTQFYNFGISPSMGQKMTVRNYDRAMW